MTNDNLTLAPGAVSAAWRAMAEADPMVRAYLTAALWTDDPDPRGGEFCTRDGWSLAEIDPASVARAISDCDTFRASAAPYLEGAEADAAQVGHDFWLTRNGHGAGFWDRPGLYHGQHTANTLTEIAHSYGEIYVTADGVALEGDDEADATDEEPRKIVIYVE